MQVTIYRKDKPIKLEFVPTEDPQTFFGRNHYEMVEHFGDERTQRLIALDEVDRAEDELYVELLEQGALFEIMTDCYAVWLEENF